MCLDRESFIELDSTLHHLFRKNRRWSGSTCTATLITPAHIFTANLGDSRTLLVQRVPAPSKCPDVILEVDEDLLDYIDPGVTFSTSDHKPTDERESRRISGAGLKVRDGRVQGNLAVSRAFGDFQYKKVKDTPQLEQPVSCLPDVHSLPRSKNDEYLVLACDGIYDVLSNEEVAVLLRSHFAEKERIEQTAEEILDICLNRGSIDNMTMIIIAFESIFEDDEYVEDGDLSVDKLLLNE